MGAFASEVAVQCAELREAGRVRLASYPAVIGCTAQAPAASIDLPVGEDESATLFVGYSTARVDQQARQRTLVAVGIVSAAFVITLLSAGLGFRWLVSRRLDRLHRAIVRAANGVERVQVEPSRGNDELGDIIRAYDALVVREERHEAELHTMHARLDEQRRRDPLTGAFNRRHVQEHIHEVAARSGAALALLDIDHFKRINDRHGHGVGDEVLVEVAQRIGQVTGRQDLFARWGGEEFLLCVGQVGEGGLEGLAQRLLACLSREPVPTSAGPIEVTSSIGLVAFPLRTGAHAHSWADAVTSRGLGAVPGQAVGAGLRRRGRGAADHRRWGWSADRGRTAPDRGRCPVRATPPRAQRPCVIRRDGPILRYRQARAARLKRSCWQQAAAVGRMLASPLF